MTTIATISASGAIRVRSSSDAAGHFRAGAAPETSPSAETPWLSSPKAATSAAAPATPISAPGMRGSMRSLPSMIARTPRPMASVRKLVDGRAPISAPAWSMNDPCAGSRPSSAGACERTMWPAMPVRKPVVTGIDRRSATQPSRNSPAATRTRPTINASVAASDAYCGEPAAARSARPPAKIGAIVESAPTDITRLDPNTAKPSAPAMIARKPICGANPARRAVAICSGMAIAASVRPAMKSGLRSARRQPAKDWRIGQRRRVGR